MVELLLAVNGDIFNNNGLTATKSVSDSSSVVLSVSATAYLEPWQTLSLMIRSTGVGAFDVVSGSMFSVVLLGKFSVLVGAVVNHTPSTGECADRLSVYNGGGSLHLRCGVKEDNFVILCLNAGEADGKLLLIQML